MTDEEFAALERRLASVLCGGGRGYVDRHDVLDLLAECRRLRLPPDVAGLMPVAELAEVRRWPHLPTHRTPKLLAHIDALESLVRELYGVVSDLLADDPGRQALLERGRAEGRGQALGVLREHRGVWQHRSTDERLKAGPVRGLDGLEEKLKALGPCRPPPPPHAAEAEAGRLREALLACVRAVGQVTRAEPAGVMGVLFAAYESAKVALGEDAP